MEKNKSANHSKKILAILLALVFIIPLTLIIPVRATDSGEYMTINGVLDSDRYSLYPYRAKSLKVGLSKFGELIDDTTNIGLEYAGERDPFAPIAGTPVPPELQKKVWINGWFIDIRYNHSVWGYRNVWAGALFADITSYAGPWLRVDDDYGSCTYEWQEAFNRPGKEIDVSNPGQAIGPLKHGGRKTNGTVLTDPLQVLYDGPRLFVAKITNHIYDWWETEPGVGENRHIVDLVLTVIFNKVKKEVIVLKDVKLVPPAKFEVSPLKLEVPEGLNGEVVEVPCGYLVQLSNREEWDLGTVYAGTTSYSSYVHFYVAGNPLGSEGQYTYYDRSWTMLPTLPAGVAVKGVVVNMHGPEPLPFAGTYDVAQIISNDKKYVGWHAFWPSLSDWSVTAGDDNTWWRALTAGDPHTVDGYSEPWRSPLVVGEWDFLLSDQHRIFDKVVEADVQFRGVSVYGVTDKNDGDDVKIGGSNIIDKEVRYQLDEVFNPWDLYAAIHKMTQRHVTFGEAPQIDLIPEENKVVWIPSEWDAYSVFAEKVIDLSTGKLLKRDDNYTISGPPPHAMIPQGTLYYEATITTRNIPAGTPIKVLWSTLRCEEKVDYIYIDKYDGVFVYRLSHWPIHSPPQVFVVNITDPTNPSIVDPTYWDVDPVNGLIFFYPPTKPGSILKVIYDAFVGQYEWIVVGRDAASVDSAGAALVSEAFDSLKNIRIGIAGAEMYNPTRSLQMPWVMAKFGAGNARADYYYSSTDFRTALKDDWCRTWPIASSNMIAEGGPRANLLAWYGNDFAQAFFGLTEFTDFAAWENAIVPLTCWNISKTRTFRSSETTGYAVISTYKDINGTVLFMVWGYDGRDTFYVSKWFHDEGIIQLQEAPRGLTSIIVEITYKSTSEGYKPTKFNIVECLGTISETLWKHNDEIKGGIHDP